VRLQTDDQLLTRIIHEAVSEATEQRLLAFSQCSLVFEAVENFEVDEITNRSAQDFVQL
jgi:hypothetical protein